jgi:hypothetical protein
MSERALARTRIGRAVNALSGHRSGRVRTLSKRLVRKWKDLVLAPPGQRERPQPHEPVSDEERVRSSCRATLAARLQQAAAAATAFNAVTTSRITTTTANTFSLASPAAAAVVEDEQQQPGSVGSLFADAIGESSEAVSEAEVRVKPLTTLVEELATAGERVIWATAGRRVGPSHGRVLRGVVTTMDADRSLAPRLLSGEITFEAVVASSSASTS